MILDYSDGNGGFCATVTDNNGKEVILSQCMVNGTHGVTTAIIKMCTQMREVPTISFRWSMLMKGMEMEMKGMRSTGKTPDASALVKREFGVKKGLSKSKTLDCFKMLLNLALMLQDDELLYNQLKRIGDEEE